MGDLGAVSRGLAAERSGLQDLGLTDWELNGLWITVVLQQVLLQVTAGGALRQSLCRQEPNIRATPTSELAWLFPPTPA